MVAARQLPIAGASLPEAGMPEEQIRSTIKYIMKGRDYKAKVARANSARFTFLPPYDNRWQPRPMNSLDRFLSGSWRKGSWEAFILKENARGDPADQHRRGPGMSLKRRVTLAFIGAFLADIALSFIIWLSLMMGISLFDLESKWGVQIEAYHLLVGTFAVLFVLLFLAFLLLIRPKKPEA